MHSIHFPPQILAQGKYYLHGQGAGQDVTRTKLLEMQALYASSQPLPANLSLIGGATQAAASHIPFGRLSF